jgi:serine phosphatase RsbU (regulator of sigma subunit)
MMNELQRQIQTLGQLQRHLLPREIPQPESWQIAVHYAVGRWPGGNYYDLLRLPDGRILVLVADASEQGAPASALIAMTRVVLHSCPLSSGAERLPFCPFSEPLTQPPHVLLGHLNRVLAENSLEEQFLTAFCGVLNPCDGTFHFANAGYPAPRWWRASSRVVEPLRHPVGLPLGIDRMASYHHKRVEIEPGDLVLFCSGGLTAAQNTKGQLFGSERLDHALRDTASGGAESVKSAVLSRLEDFLARRELDVDVNLLIVERLS